MSDLPSPHPATSLFERRPLVFTAHGAESAYLRERIVAHALGQGVIPVNPWMMGGYFLYGLVDKDAVRRANNNLLMRSDEVWVYGPVTDGVQVEIDWAAEAGLPLRRFDLDHYGEQIAEVSP